MLSEDPSRGIFKPLLEPETAVPVRRAGIFGTPAREGADVLVTIVEATRVIEIKKPVPKAQRRKGANGKMTPKSSNASDAELDGETSNKTTIEDEKDEDDNDSGSDSDSDDDDDDELEDIRSKDWKVGKPMAEMAIKGVKKGGKVEVTVNIGADMTVSMTAREVGGQGGVRGQLDKVVENGSA